MQLYIILLYSKAVASIQLLLILCIYAIHPSQRYIKGGVALRTLEVGGGGVL